MCFPTKLWRGGEFCIKINGNCFLSAIEMRTLWYIVPLIFFILVAYSSESKNTYWTKRGSPPVKDKIQRNTNVGCQCKVLNELILKINKRLKPSLYSKKRGIRKIVEYQIWSKKVPSKVYLWFSIQKFKNATITI